MTRPISELRSKRPFAANDFRSFGHRQRLQQTGLRREDFIGKPAVGIIHTWSDISPCHARLGKPCGMVMGQAEAVNQCIEVGYSYVAVASDLGMLMARAGEMLAKMRPAAALKA